jgi:transcription elongation factor Elf1
MGFLKKLAEMFTAPSALGSRMRWYYIQCGKCGKKIKIGVNMSSEVVNNYADTKSGSPAYTLRKVAQDDHCFTPIEINIGYDQMQKEIDKKIQGGKFLSEEEFKTE